MIAKYVYRCILALMVACLLVGQTLAEVTLPADPENFHIFLLMGQSNMAGYGGVVATDPYLPGDMDTVPGVYVLDGQSSVSSSTPSTPVEWRNGSHRLHILQGTAQFGPGMDFAKEYMRLNPGVSVGLIPCAWGGAPINSLNKGTPLYQNAITRAEVAAASGRIKGVLWHQGESDSVTVALANQYEGKLTQLVVDLRRDLSQPTLLFIVGNLAEFYGEGRSAEHNAGITIIRQALRDLAAKDPWSGFVETDGLSCPDTSWVHFDRASAIILGERYARVASPLVDALMPFNIRTPGVNEVKLDWATAIGQIYAVQHSLDIADWSIISSNIQDISFLDTDPFRTGQPHGFYRLLISSEPFPVARDLISGIGGGIAGVEQTSGDALVSWSGPIGNLINNATSLDYVQANGFQKVEDVAWVDNTPAATLIFTLDQNYDLTHLHFWGYKSNYSVTDMTISFSSDLVSAFTGDTPVNHTNYVDGVTSYGISANNVRRVKIFASNNGGGETSVISEVAFEGATVVP